MDAPGLKVTGAKELRKAMKGLQEPNVLNDLKDVHVRIGELVAGRARSIASSKGRAPARAAATLRVGRRTTGAFVSLGTENVPYALGQEFGANQDKQRTGPSGRRYIGYRQFPRPARRDPNTGFLYPAVRGSRDLITAEYLRGIDAIIAKIQ